MRGVLAIALLLFAGNSALAAGLLLPGHGARGLGRAGAMVAGGGDVGALWYNPANLAGLEGFQGLLDASVVLYDLSYQRVDSGGNSRPSIDGAMRPIPLPNLALSQQIGQRLWIGGAVGVPLTGLLLDFPRPSYDACSGSNSGCLDAVVDEAPQRYTLISLTGTTLLRMDLGVAYRLHQDLVLGLSIQNLFVGLSVLKSLSAYDGLLGGGPEDPDFDVLTKFELVDLFNPSLQVGLHYSPHAMITLGASLQLPFWIDATGDVSVQLPASEAYAKATVEGSEAGVKLMLPLSVSAGVELRPTERLSFEVDFTFEQWSGTRNDCPVGDGKTEPCELLIEPRGIAINNLPGIPHYQVPAIPERLGFKDALSVRFGAEVSLIEQRLSVRGGYAFELSAVQQNARSILANDANKHLLTLGVSVRAASWLWIDASYGLLLMPTVDVSHENSEARQINPIKTDLSVAVGGGRYEATAHLLSLGCRLMP